MKEQLKEGIVWDECFPLHTKIQCQVLWKGLFTQRVGFHPLTYILSQIPVVCSQARVPTLPAGKLCLGFSVAGGNAIRQHFPAVRSSSTWGFPLAVLSLQVGRRSCQLPVSVPPPEQCSVPGLCLTTAAYSQLQGDLQAVYSVAFPYDLPHARLHFQFFNANDSVTGFYVVLLRHRRRARIPSFSFASLPTLWQLLSSLGRTRFGGTGRGKGKINAAPSTPAPA